MNCTEFTHIIRDLILVVTVCFNNNIEKGLNEIGKSWTMPSNSDMFSAVTWFPEVNRTDTLFAKVIFKEENNYTTLVHEAVHIAEKAMPDKPRSWQDNYVYEELKASLTDDLTDKFWKICAKEKKDIYRLTNVNGNTYMVYLRDGRHIKVKLIHRQEHYE